MFRNTLLLNYSRHIFSRGGSTFSRGGQAPPEPHLVTGLVGGVVRQCGVEDLAMRGCELTAEHITAFQRGIGDGKFKILNVSYNDGLKPKGCRAVGDVVRLCGVEDLGMRSCGLTAEHITAFQKGIGDGKFKKLKVGRNNSLEPKGCKAVGGVVRQCGVEDLDMRWCELTVEHITAFQRGIGDGKFKILDVSVSCNLKPEGCKAVGGVVRQCGVEDLRMLYCNLTAEHITAFQKGIGDGKFKILTLSENWNLKPEGCKAVGGVVHQCGVEDLRMQYCRLTAEHITAFQKGIGDGKVTRLDISGGLWGNGDKIVDALINLLEHCKVKNLIAERCYFHENQRHCLHDAAGKFGTELKL